MDKIEALEELSERVIFKTVRTRGIEDLGFKLKSGKTLGDVVNAKHLKRDQQPGGYEIMVAHVESNLKEIVDFVD